MGALYTAAKAKTGISPRTPLGICSITGVLNLADQIALVATDVVQMVKIPAGATILDVILDAPDMDTGANTTLSVGDGGATARYISASTIGQAGGVARLAVQGGHGYKYTVDDTIDLLMAAGPATAVTGNVTLTVLYTMDA